MKKILPILFAIATISLASNCSKTTPVDPIVIEPTPGILSMNFKAIYSNKPLVINQINDYNGKKVRFERLQFFLAYDAGNLEAAVGTNLPKTALIKFTPLEDSTSAAAGVSTEIVLASRTWTSINFGIGIPKNLNAILPKNFVFPDPMADGGNFWDGWQSYVFSKLEGKIDKDGDGILETPFTLHTGGDDVFTAMKFTKSFVIQDGKTTKVNFELNVNELIKNIDLATVNSSHQIGSAPIMKTIMGNYTTALTVK
jgi:hypothetical protein